jgi:hypothetical protein
MEKKCKFKEKYKQQKNCQKFDIKNLNGKIVIPNE